MPIVYIYVPKVNFRPYSFIYFYRMKFEIGEKVFNTITRKVYIVVDLEEFPYIRLKPIGKEVDPNDEIYISVHMDFLDEVIDD